MLSFQEIAKMVHKRLDFGRSIFFWQSYEKKQKYINQWNLVCIEKDRGFSLIEVLDVKKMFTQHMAI
jgi:hypothetical protein